MSDYTQIVDYGPKDSLPTGDSDKKILGTQIDAELDAISVAIATKYDSTDVASQAQAEAETLSTVLVTPLNLAHWSDYNAGVVGDLQAMTTAGFSAADALFGWDNSAAAAIGFTLGTGLAFDTTTVKLSHLGLEALVDPNADLIMFWDDSAGAVGWLTSSDQFSITDTTVSLNITNLEADLNHDNLTGFVGNEHIDHSTVSITAGSGLTGGGTIAATRTINVGAGAGISVAADAVALDISGLTAYTEAAVIGTDGFLVDDGGTMKRMQYDDAGFYVQSGATTKNVADTDSNSLLYVTAGTNQTFTFNTGVGHVGAVMHFVQGGAGTVILAAGTATVNGANGLKTANQYSMITAVCVASNTWVVVGDSKA